jgi:hypothetical protein
MTHGRIFFHVTKYFVLGVRIFKNILSTWEEYSIQIFDPTPLPMFTYSRSCLQAHEIVSMKDN